MSHFQCRFAFSAWMDAFSHMWGTLFYQSVNDKVTDLASADISEQVRSHRNTIQLGV